MLNKNDPLVSAIQDVMRKNQAERDAVKAVNEKFGVQDRRVLPHEKQGEWDAAYQSVLTEGVEVLDEDWNPRARDERDRVRKAAKTIRRGRQGEIKDFAGKIADDLGRDAVDGGNRAAMTRKTMNQLYGKNKSDRKAIEKISEEEKLSSAQKHHMDVDDDNDIDSKDLEMKRMGMKEGSDPMGGDQTKPSTISKGPNYAPAGTTPDYANKGPQTQTPNRKAKSSLPAGISAGTMKEEEQIDEKAPPGRENQVKALKKKFPKGSGSPFAIAWSSYKKKKKLDEGFNNRHDSSVTASVERQVVAELYAVPGTPAGNAYANSLKNNVGKPALPLQAGQKPGFSDRGIRRRVAPIRSTSPATKSSSGAPTMAPGKKLNRPTGNYNPAAGTGTPPVTAPANPMMGQTQRQNFAPGAAAAAKRANMSGGGGNYAAPGAVAAGAAAAAKRANMSGGGGNYAAARKSSIVSTGNPKIAGSAGSGMSARDPKSSNALSARMRQTAGQRQGATAPPKPSIAADNPVVSKTTTNPVEPKTFKDAFAAARKAAAEKGSTSTGKFTFKGKEYQTNTKGEKYVAASKQTDVTPKPTTTTSVTGGQGISGIASNSVNKPVVKPAVDAKAQGFAPAGIASRPTTGIGPQQAPKPAAPTPDAMSNLGRVSQRTSGPSTSLDSPSPRATSQQTSDIVKNISRANSGLPLPPRNKI